MKNKTNLFLIVTRHWYEEIACGRKRVEYRMHTMYWHKRLNDIRTRDNGFCGLYTPKNYKTVEFQLGYSLRHPRLKFKVKKIEFVKTPEEVKDTIKTIYCFAILFE